MLRVREPGSSCWHRRNLEPPIVEFARWRPPVSRGICAMAPARLADSFPRTDLDRHVSQQNASRSPASTLKSLQIDRYLGRAPFFQASGATYRSSPFSRPTAGASPLLAVRVCASVSPGCRPTSLVVRPRAAAAVAKLSGFRASTPAPNSFKNGIEYMHAPASAGTRRPKSRFSLSIEYTYSPRAIAHRSRLRRRSGD
jgi:hypothetical protein